MTDATLMDALPDPDRHAELYDGVTARRGLAWLADITLIFLVTLVIVPLTAFTALFFYPLLFIAVGFAYRWWTLARGSATWGMRLFGIEFLNRHGQRLNGTEALLHVTGYMLSMGTMLVQLLSIGLMLTTRRRQGLTDLALGTVAINRAS
ncbi:RDD family protein [Falsirhodobacter sp. 20TX0035]|uniref:RDD family protein n=1 Tax=Falsirhodobacter sp. 20TX0035 TaxID=3022019 RepID=UPI00232D2D64|nr:RDD family protein [Falsirhodobacter sp. 20TX0035]MDB6453321.1 RDD family protein [Falsirhodobacter sp. 20TX0035]